MRLILIFHKYLKLRGNYLCKHHFESRLFQQKSVMQIFQHSRHQISHQRNQLKQQNNKQLMKINLYPNRKKIDQHHNKNKELEKFIETKVSSISTSPERNDTILIVDPFKS